MSAEYQSIRGDRGQFDSLPITADDVLAADRSHAKYLRGVPPRDYQMRVFGDGSVLFLNTAQPTLRCLIPLAEIQKAAREVFWLSPHRSLWQHIFALWA